MLRTRPCAPRAQLDIAKVLLEAGSDIAVMDHAVKGATAEMLFTSNRFGEAFEEPMTITEWVKMLRGEQD